MKILVVDDDLGNRNLAARMLTLGTGLETATADSGIACIRACEAETYDAVLLDISMPGLNGITVCQTLRGMPAYRHCNIIACTAHAGREEIANFVVAGFSGTLTKPFFVGELFAALHLDSPLAQK